MEHFGDPEHRPRFKGMGRKYRQLPRGKRTRTFQDCAMFLADGLCDVGLWGWPGFDGKPLFHARAETAHRKPTWRTAWDHHRAIVPIDGWFEGTWHVKAPGSYLAVLWHQLTDDEIRFAVLTQATPERYQFLERFPIPLTEQGADAWLADRQLDGQVTDLHPVDRNDGTPSIF